MIYAYIIHTCLDVATITRKLQKKCIHDIRLYYSYMFRCSYNNQKTPNVLMIYAYATHTCLDVALMEGNLYPL